MYVPHGIKVRLAAGMDDFYRDSIDVGDECIHSCAGAELSLLDEVDRIFDRAAVRRYK